MNGLDRRGLLIAAWGCWLMVGCVDPPPPPPEVGEAPRRPLFPFDFELQTADGKTVSLADYRGRALVVNIWGTWCGPCRQELPHLIRLHHEYEARGLEVVGINFERAGSPEAGRRLMKSAIQAMEIPYPCLVGEKSVQRQIPGFRSFPTTLFIDRDGHVRGVVEGAYGYETFASVAEELLTVPAVEPDEDSGGEDAQEEAADPPPATAA